MSKALGQEINEFYNNHFPENSFTDEDEDWIEQYMEDNGNLNLPVTEKFELSDFGVIVNDTHDTIKTFSSVFKKWQRAQHKSFVLVEIDATNKDKTIARLKELGFKVKN